MASVQEAITELGVGHCETLLEHWPHRLQHLKAGAWRNNALRQFDYYYALAELSHSELKSAIERNHELRNRRIADGLPALACV